jgi:hypothetical protein
MYYKKLRMMEVGGIENLEGELGMRRRLVI